MDSGAPEDAKPEARCAKSGAGLHEAPPGTTAMLAWIRAEVVCDTEQVSNKFHLT